MNTNMSCNTLTDKERMSDALTSQKFLTSEYNNFVNEAATPEVKQALMSILNEEHSIQQEVWTEMNTRGWYPTEKAEDQKLQQEKMKFGSYCASCK